MSTRVFADFRHKLPVPSPDTYFKVEHNPILSPQRQSIKKVVVGAAFNATNNSEHTWRGIRSFDRSPERFNNVQDNKEAKKPAPTSYKPKDAHRRKLLA